MAIVIPSSKTYDRQNPKVRDNVIERIEVGAVEVVPNNEYETPVYNNNKVDLYSIEIGTTIKDIEGARKNIVGTNYTYSVGNYIEFIPSFIKNLQIVIPKLKYNKYIESLLLGKNKQEEYNISIMLYYKHYTGTASAEFKYSILSSSSEIKNITKNYSNLPENITKKFVPLKEEELSNEYQGTNVSVYDLLNSSYGNSAEDITGKTGYSETDNDFSFYISFLCGYEKSILQGEGEFDSSDWFTITGNCEKYIAQKIEITVYGNTIGIDLQDKTVYINGETAKKVHSVEGNELMQTANYMVDKNGTKTKAIDKMYGDTQTDYAKGKETAKIRCSISDYYDGDQKVISIDNSTGKMSFDIGDQVIPMVYGADGKDRPMSTYQDGSAKEFEVLGKEKFYDGAVWQELSLQEIAKKIEKEPIQPLTAPYLEINGSILKINNTDQRATEFSILVDGNEMAKTTNDSFNLSLLNLPVGSYSITAKSKAFGLENSQESNQVIFVVVEENPDEPEILKNFEIDNMLVIDGDTKENIADVFVEGTPTIEQDEEGNTLFNYDNLALVISSNSKKDPNNLLWLVSGEKIIFFPFDMNSSNYEQSLNWIYRLTIEKAKNGAVISYKDIGGNSNYVPFNYWEDTPVTIEFYMDNGVGTIKITDKDGYGTTVTNVDFSMGVTILSN